MKKARAVEMNQYVVKFIGHDGVERQTQPFSNKMSAEFAIILIPFKAWVEVKNEN